MLNSKSLGNKIAIARKNSNLSQLELAKKISISPQAVGKWERGESMPDISKLNQIAEILGVDLNYFSDNFNTKEFSETKIIKTDNQENEIQKITGKKSDRQWDMSQGNWNDADFSGLKNLKEKFNSSNMKNCKFIKTDLSGLMLFKNNIELCDFTGSDISASKIHSSNLLNNQFNKCLFTDADFNKSNFCKCDFSESDFSGAEFTESNLENNTVNAVVWRFTKFLKTNFNKVIFTGIFEDCHFERCGFYGVKFENATLLNSFFKYNEKFRKVQFVNCSVDSITFAFLKNNQANITGIKVIT